MSTTAASGHQTTSHRTRRVLCVVTTILLGVGTLLGAPATARAATVAPTLSNLTVTPGTGSVWRTLTTSFDWCVPDGTQPGDTFVVRLPDLLGNWPATFPLATTSGTQVATGTVNPGPPSYLTVTFAASVAGQTNVCGTVQMQAQLRNPVASAGTTQTLDYSTSTGTLTAQVSFDPLAPNGLNPNATKEGWFGTVDQCRTDGTDCLWYAIATPEGPISQDVTIVDTLPAGQSLDCSTLSPYWQDMQGNWVRGLNDTRWTLNSCTSRGLSVTIHGVLDGLKAVVQFAVSVPPSTTGGVAYDNAATVTVTGRTPATVTAHVVSNLATGTAIGSAITVDKRDVNGHTADTVQDRAVLPTGSVGIVVTYTNTSLGDLHGILVDDTTVVGTGTVRNLSCDFSKAVAGAPTSGTTWAGPWPTGTTFTCTGTLTGVTPQGHRDVATVTAYDQNENVVRGRNPYNAVRPVVSVGDHVWWDTNRDGIQDAGEKPVAGVVVDLLDATGRVIGTTTTSSTGFYSFQGLATGTSYRVRFHAPGGASFTRALAGTSRAVDSNPGANGLAAFTTPLTGSNSATAPDLPTIDAGLVRDNLRLAKVLTTKGPFVPGQKVTYTLTPSNDGPTAALAGWSVTEVPPAGLSITSMSGFGYACNVSTRTCTASRALLPGRGNPITVVATIRAGVSGTVHNVAYVRPVRGDIAETVPLGSAPTSATNTATSRTDNDAQASFSVVNRVWTVWVQADLYRPVVPGNAAATKANSALVASLDDDGVLRYREDMGTRCQVRNSPTCLWYRSTVRIVKVTIVSPTRPTQAQLMAAYNKVAPAATGKAVTTSRLATANRTVMILWQLGTGASPAQPWGPKHDVNELYVAHS